jgi:hypothetical protein
MRSRDPKLKFVCLLETQQYICLCYPSIQAEPTNISIERQFCLQATREAQNRYEESSLRLTLGRRSKEEKLVTL